MKKMMLAIAVCLGFALMSCQKNSDASGLLSASSARAGGAERCKGKPKPNCPCTDVLAPVCGCDGITYNNSCEATCAGVLSYTPGSCEGPERKR